MQEPRPEDEPGAQDDHTSGQVQQEPTWSRNRALLLTLLCHGVMAMNRPNLEKSAELEKS